MKPSQLKELSCANALRLTLFQLQFLQSAKFRKGAEAVRRDSNPGLNPSAPELHYRLLKGRRKRVLSRVLRAA